MKATSKAPADRYDSAGEFAAALTSALEPKAAGSAAGAVAPAATAGAAPAATPAAPARVPAKPKPKADLAKGARTILRWQISLVLRILSIAFLLVELLLIARIVITAASGELGGQLVSQVRGLTDPLAAPFQGITDGLLADPALAKRADLAALASLVVIFVLSRVVDAVGQRILIRYSVSNRW
jgi:hypothetical protein